MRVEEPVTGLCDYRGRWHQNGRYGSFGGTFKCTDGSSGDFTMSRVEVTSAGITGNINTVAAGLIGRGRFGAVRQ